MAGDQGKMCLTGGPHAGKGILEEKRHQSPPNPYKLPSAYAARRLLPVRASPSDSASTLASPSPHLRGIVSVLAAPPTTAAVSSVRPSVLGGGYDHSTGQMKTLPWHLG